MDHTAALFLECGLLRRAFCCSGFLPSMLWREESWIRDASEHLKASVALLCSTSHSAPLPCCRQTSSTTNVLCPTPHAACALDNPAYLELVPTPQAIRVRLALCLGLGFFGRLLRLRNERTVFRDFFKPCVACTPRSTHALITMES